MERILIKYLLGEATPGERARVDQWLSADSRNQERYEQLKTAWDTSRQSAPPTTPDPQEALQRLQHRLHSKGTVVRRIRPFFRPMRGERQGGKRRGMMAAAILIAVFVTGAIIFFVQRGRTGDSAFRKPGQVSGNTTITPTGTSGETSSIARSYAMPAFPANQLSAGWHYGKATDSVKKMLLPDNSVVTLNRGGQLAYSKVLQNNERVVSLRGEAFFAVAPDLAHPFIVRVGDMTLQVLGTSFNVREQPDGIEVIVETGAVRVSRGKDNMIAHPGEKILAATHDGKISRSVNDDPFYGYYLDRPLVCDSVPMESVVAMLNKAYDAHIVIAADGLASRPLTTVFHHAPLDKVLAVLGATFDFEVVPDHGTIFLRYLK